MKELKVQIRPVAKIAFSAVLGLCVRYVWSSFIYDFELF